MTFEVGKADPCQWTDWSSCDFFCNTSRVTRRTRKRAEKDSNGQCRKEVDVLISTEEGDCDVNHQCTGISKNHQYNAFIFQFHSYLVHGEVPNIAIRIAAQNVTDLSCEPATQSAPTYRHIFLARCNPLSEEETRRVLQYPAKVKSGIDPIKNDSVPRSC